MTGTLTHDTAVRVGAEPIGRISRIAALLSGVTGLASLALVLGGETIQGHDDFVTSGPAALAGWLGYVSACLLVMGIVGIAVRFSRELSAVGQGALALLTLATAVMVGNVSTLALIVPTLADQAPSILNEPPNAVPATYVLSGLVMGISAIVLAIALRRAFPSISTRVSGFLIVAAVVAMAPLPAHSFLLGFAIAALKPSLDGAEV